MQISGEEHRQCPQKVNVLAGILRKVTMLEETIHPSLTVQLESQIDAEGKLGSVMLDFQQDCASSHYYLPIRLRLNSC